MTTQRVYNLEVETTHCYFAGGVLVSNCHTAKGGDTDIGAADGRLLSSVDASLALTGTIFGGAASSLFYLLFRRNHEVRSLYNYKEVSKWIDHFGRWKFEWNEREHNAERGKSSGIERWNERAPSELPGVSPAVIRFLLPMTLFGKITDLGYTLPPLTDRVELVDMGKELGDHYRALNNDLLDKAMERLKTDHDPGLLSVWFATMRYRPMSAWREEEVRFKGELIMPLPALVKSVERLPKEKRLVEIVSENAKHGRKTLIFVEQTGTRDIRERLLGLLAQTRLGVQSLSSGDMKPAKREMWIKRHASTMDALTVNAKLVETGLDLVMFSDIVFYETSVSLYTMWQAMRRVWRLGQKNAVTTTFLAYRDTVEAALLELMGEKMKGAMLLYGDNASGALIESDDEDASRLLVQRALEGKTIANAGEINGKSIFGNDDQGAIMVTHSPLGSSTAASEPLPMMLPAEVEWVQYDLFGNEIGVVTVKSKSKRR